MKNIDYFKQNLVNYLSLNINYVSLFWKGRVALYAILKAIGIKEGDEIILPAFTCVVVPNPIIYLGAKPVYVDINPKTLNIDTEKITKKITKKTKAIIAQNTFGLPPDFDKIIEIANKYNLHVIEDASHGFGSVYKGKKSGTIIDYAFFSTQWNKPFSTGLGGIAVTKNQEVTNILQQLEKKAIKPSKKEEYLLKMLIDIRDKIVNSNTYWHAIKFYRFLSKKNLIIGSSQSYELEKPIMPKDFLKGFTETQAKEGVKYFKKINGHYKIDLIIEHRRRISRLYKGILASLDFEPPYEPDYVKHSYLKFPLLVKDRRKFFYLAQDWKIPLGDWFLSPIHPIEKNFYLWFYNYGENPFGEYVSRHIVNLPTDIEEEKLNKIEDFLKRHKDEIIGCSVPKKLEE